MAESHGDEAHLVPLLDLVLQMLMFFVATTNFAMENVNENVLLPLAQSAKPVEDLGTDIVYVNVDQRGNLLIPADKQYPDGKIDGMEGKELDANNRVIPSKEGRFNPATRSRNIRNYLKIVFDNNKTIADARKEDRGKVRTLVILRAHSEAEFRDVYEVLKQCRSAGFSKMQLRATRDQRN